MMSFPAPPPMPGLVSVSGHIGTVTLDTDTVAPTPWRTLVGHRPGRFLLLHSRSLGGGVRVWASDTVPKDWRRPSWW